MLLQLLEALSNKKKQKVQSSPRGEYYDLQEIFNVLNEKYFANKVDLPLQWFGRRDFRPRQRIVLGSYHLDKRVIRIHRILDKEHVPYHVVSFVVYHEMLHHVLPPIKGKKRRRKIHHPEFVRREKLFVEYALAREGIELLLQP